MCFFLQAIQSLHGEFPGLFNQRNDEGEPDDSPAPKRNDVNFHTHFGWIYNTRQVADFEKISMDAAYELPVMQVLNDLSYLKAKENHEKELNKKMYK